MASTYQYIYVIRGHQGTFRPYFHGVFSLICELLTLSSLSLQFPNSDVLELQTLALLNLVFA